MSTSTLSSKFQVSIPKALRDRLSWRPGQKIAFIAKADGVLMVSVPDREALFGIAPGVNTEGYRDRDDRF